MISIGERIDLEKLIDFNDIEKFVNSGTFAMLLPEDNKKDYVNFRKKKHFKTMINESLLIILNFFLKNRSLINCETHTLKV